jgi:hypothetical protein
VANSQFFDSVFEFENEELENQCNCDNYILEAHYKVFFEQNPALANSFFITDLIVDVVYGRLTQSCTLSNTFNLKTSVLFLESGASGRVFSGSPGYTRGSPVLIG